MRHRPVECDLNRLVLLSTVNLEFRGTPTELQRRFVGPFRVVERIGKQAYRLAYSENWRTHIVFHVSLLKPWRESSYVQVSHPLDITEIEDSDDKSLH